MESVSLSVHYHFDTQRWFIYPVIVSSYFLLRLAGKSCIHYWDDEHVPAKRNDCSDGMKTDSSRTCEAYESAANNACFRTTVLFIWGGKPCIVCDLRIQTKDNSCSQASGLVFWRTAAQSQRRRKEIKVFPIVAMNERKWAGYDFTKRAEL